MVKAFKGNTKYPSSQGRGKTGFEEGLQLQVNYDEVIVTSEESNFSFTNLFQQPSIFIEAFVRIEDLELFTFTVAFFFVILFLSSGY